MRQTELSLLSNTQPLHQESKTCNTAHKTMQKYTAESPNAQKVSVATGTNSYTLVTAMTALAASSSLLHRSTIPATMTAFSMWLGTTNSGRVNSHARQRPCARDKMVQSFSIQHSVWIFLEYHLFWKQAFMDQMSCCRMAWWRSD